MGRRRRGNGNGLMMVIRQLLVGAVLLLYYSAAICNACGDTCAVDPSTALWHCPIWPITPHHLPIYDGNGGAVPCFGSNLGDACAACAAAGAEGFVCQTSNRPSVAPGLGICRAGRCQSCMSVGINASACADTRLPTSAGPVCEWDDTIIGGGACRLSVAPCVCQAVAGDAPDFGCYGKGGATSNMYCGSNCGFAVSCGDNPDTEARHDCEQRECAWHAGNATCGPCDCRCNGCLDAGGACVSRTTSTKAMCTGGTWCECSPMSCSIARREETCRVARVGPSSHATLTGSCTWDPARENYVEEVGACGECFVDAHCVSGVCLIDPTLRGAQGGSGGFCGPCDRAACSGHGSGAHHSAGVCRCSCDPGYIGDRCEQLDCRTSALGAVCARCSSSSGTRHLPCRSAEGVVDVCFDGKTCGSRPLACGLGNDIATCHGGSIGGNYTTGCYCSCPDGRYGAYCELASPFALTCAAATATGSRETFTLIVHNGNDRDVDARLCFAERCHGNTRGAPGQYQSCSTLYAGTVPGQDVTIGLLPPRQTVQLRLPSATHFIVFIDKTCGDLDAELWPPAGGFVSRTNVTFSVPRVCAAEPVPSSPTVANNPGFKPPRCDTFSGCASPRNNTAGWEPCTGAQRNRYPDPPSIAPCNRTMCCERGDVDEVVD